MHRAPRAAVVASSLGLVIAGLVVGGSASRGHPAGAPSQSTAVAAAQAAGGTPEAGSGGSLGSAKGDDVEPVVAGPISLSPARAAPDAAAPSAQPAAAPSASPGNAWAVIIGISHYWGSTHPTYGGDGDANAVLTALRQAGWPDDHILFLTDDAATASAMRGAMQWLVNHSNANSFSVFHYSGHVHQTGPHSEQLWPVDNNLISNDEFSNYMRAVQGRAWIDISGCESAGFDRGASSPSRLFSGSSQENEKSFEVPEWHESVWTGLTVDQGILQRKADQRGDGHVSIQEAVNYGATQAPQVTADQQPGPQHPYLVGGGGPDWYLDFPKPPPPPPPPPSGGQSKPGSGSGGKTTPTTAPPDPCANLTRKLVRC